MKRSAPGRTAAGSHCSPWPSTPRPCSPPHVNRGRVQTPNGSPADSPDKLLVFSDVDASGDHHRWRPQRTILATRPCPAATRWPCAARRPP
eukprot:377893-Pyramimonas_sp.AAC.1